MSFNYDGSPVDEDDDFMQFYRKFRPSLSSSASFQGSSRTTSSSSPNFSQMSDRLQRLKRQWYHPKRRLPPKSYSNERGTPEEPFSPTKTSPLQGLTGMLSQKMTFSSCHSAGGNAIFPVEADSQSRDSGNSSGGSPDLRGLRKGRSVSHQLFGRPASFEKDWYTSQNFRETVRNSPHDDSRSTYSYETARDMVDPADIVLDSARQDFRRPLAAGSSSTSAYGDFLYCGDRSKYYDSFSETGMLEAWCPDNAVSKRKLDCLREDPLSLTGSPRRKRAQRGLCEPVLGKERAAGKLPQSRIALVCNGICLICKSMLVISSVCLILFATLFLWQSYRCESYRQARFELNHLRAALESNLYGQHVAREEIMQSLQEFTVSQDISVQVLILTGWLGSGKTFTSSLIRAYFPIQENVHYFSVPLHFARNTNNFHFLEDLTRHIGRSCGYSLVLFDDVDSGSALALEKIERFIVTLKSSQLASRSNGTLVLISSNVGGSAINQHVLETMKARVTDRDSLDNASLLQVLADHGGKIPCVEYLNLNGVSTRVIPYLPMTREHVRQCIKNEVKSQGFSATSHEVDGILGEIGFFSADFPVLSKTGCKQVAGKVDVFLGGQDPFLQG